MAIDVEAKAQAEAAGNSGPEPVIIDMGRKSRKQVRKLRKGKPGRLMRRVEETIEHLREGGELGENVRPIVIVVRERARNKLGRGVSKMWGLR